jgi:hypothetical protein
VCAHARARVRVRACACACACTLACERACVGASVYVCLCLCVHESVGLWVCGGALAQVCERATRRVMANQQAQLGEARQSPHRYGATLLLTSVFMKTRHNFATHTNHDKSTVQLCDKHHLSSM